MAHNYVQLEYLNDLIKNLGFGELNVVLTVHDGIVTAMQVKEAKKYKFSVEQTGVKLVVSASQYGKKPVFDNGTKKIENISN